MSEPPSGLFPAPREFALRESPSPKASRASRDATPRHSHDRSLPAEGFTIDVDADGVRIDHADAAGRRHADATLDQLSRHYGGTLPPLHLSDAPDFAVRGYMLDISRDRVPTRDTLAHLVARLARLRFNHLELYTEHTFAYPGHETVWRDASPMTPADIRWLDALCIEHGIELVPNQNTFGHMERWLSHAAYRERAEAPEGWVTAHGLRRPPAVLAPTPENATFALELVRELAQHFTSRRFHIGCDETFELGKGRSARDVSERGRGRVYLEHLLRLFAGVHADGREALFWGDILRNHPGLVGELPREDVIALVWHYEAPMTPEALPAALREKLVEFGIEADALAGFGTQVDAFAASDMPFWVCPGTSAWNSLIGRLPNARANLRDAVAVGRARGASGFLLTDWGDNGHLQPPAVSLAPMVDAAGLAWNAERHCDRDLATDLDTVLFEDAAGELGRACVTMGGLADQTGLAGWNASPLHDALLGAGPLGSVGEPDAPRCEAIVGTIDDLDAALGRARPGCADGPLVVRELRQALRLAQLSARRLAQRAGSRTAGAPGDDLRGAIAEQRACWLERARPGGLEDSLERLRALERDD